MPVSASLFQSVSAISEESCRLQHRSSSVPAADASTVCEDRHLTHRAKAVSAVWEATVLWDLPLVVTAGNEWVAKDRLLDVECKM